jgi:hypothetical protein
MLNRTTMLTYYLHCLELLIKEQTSDVGLDSRVA